MYCILKIVFYDVCRWRAKVILLRIPVRDRPEVQLKAVAFGALGQRRPMWGHNRKWCGNYLVLQVSGVEARFHLMGGGFPPRAFVY